MTDADRAAIGAKVSELRRVKRVQAGLAALASGSLTEDAARRLIRDMTQEERLTWIMERDAGAYAARLRQQRWEAAGGISNRSIKARATAIAAE